MEPPYTSWIMWRLGQKTARKCSTMSVNQTNRGEEKTFVSLRCTILLFFVPCWAEETEVTWLICLMWSFPPIHYGRYPHWYSTIFHMLPIRYKKLDSSQVNRMQSQKVGGGWSGRALTSIQKEEEKDCMEQRVACLWLQETHSQDVLLKHKTINTHSKRPSTCFYDFMSFCHSRCWRR